MIRKIQATLTKDMYDHVEAIKEYGGYRSMSEVVNKALENLVNDHDSKSPNFLQYFEFIARHHFAKLDGITIPESLDGKYFKVKGGVLTDITSAGQSYLAGQGRNGVLVLPSSITRIDNSVFTQRFQNFKAIYAEGVTEVGSFAFNETGSLNFAHLPKLKKLGEAVFTDNASLTAVNFPLLEEIGDVCFTGGANFSGNGLKITYVSIPAAKKIGSGAFHGNYKHSGVTFIRGHVSWRDAIDGKARRLETLRDGVGDLIRRPVL